ncbi:inverse autotransporter beta domain-containing protein [Enterobacter asburiae]|uniref:inverse autotransporter beta domain-containing protein n=1 Tax=Enterobacter asburiae TaxID=61645 RepID=UPI002148BAFA|nr:inverse autotransporter beta domain-containing protein [Enterobacter asburiae]UUR73854.1 inverse autotransporter beta domain-containing protein [Enterobacter asburiae]
MQLSAPSRSYILTDGETTVLVAERLGLTVEQLRKYNQFRTFSKPFERLSAGDEIDIPAPRPANGKGTPPPPETKTEDEMDARRAGGLSRAIGLLQNENKTAAVAGAARQAVTGTANDAVQQWLGQFGTVEAQLSLNEDFSLENSSIDWLVPLYETPDNVLFTQIGARNRDDRNTVNLGLGMRWFNGEWMYGTNGFYDEDLTGNNRRVSMGAELWRDYLQLSANGYFGLTGWHQSRDFDDYDERPADGFDIRLNGWLPALPQLGGKVIYEQYFGDEVALFGKDERQKNAYAVTTGINWTPFPLMTLGIDQRTGKGQMSETSVNLQLTWRPDKSWQSQIHPDGAGEMRKLSENRHSIVDRNNNIVLEYRKQELISMKMSQESIRGEPGSVHNVAVLVNSKYPTESVTWDNAAFLAAGGEFRTLSDTRFSLTLPEYQAESRVAARTQAVSPASNIYHLKAVAEDKQGNRSDAQTLVVEVLPPSAGFQGEMQVENDNAPADGVTPVTVTSSLMDGNSKPLPDQTVRMDVTLSDGSKQTKDVVTDKQGYARLDITSVVPGAATVSATFKGQSQQTGITFAAWEFAENRSSLLLSPAVIRADGQDSSQLVLKATDAQGRPMSGLKNVSFEVSGVENTTLSAVNESVPGTYTASLTGTVAGQGTVEPVINDVHATSLRRAITLTAAANMPDAAQSAMTASPATIVANGMATSLVTLSLKDGSGNPQPGMRVSLTSSLAGTTLSSVADNQDGTYTAALRGTTAGAANITANVNGSALAVTPVVVTMTGNPATAQITGGNLMVVTNNVVNDGTATNSVKATVTDAFGNSLAGEAVSFSADNGATMAATGTTGADGTVTMSLTSRTAGTSNVVASINGSTQNVNTIFTMGAAITMPGNVVVNGHNFALNSGFPSTGFAQATFRVQPASTTSTGNTGNADDYIWSDDQEWVSVDGSGNVTFTESATSSSKTVTVTATPKSGIAGMPYAYTFTVGKWFSDAGSTNRTWPDTDNYCISQGSSIPSREEMSSGLDTRQLGSLWGEWGDVTAYSGSEFRAGSYWSNYANTSTTHITIRLTDGYIYTSGGHQYDSSFNPGVCKKNI